MTDSYVVVIGAGPAGLAAAYELARHGISPVVLEKTSHIGGIARTEVYRGYRFDIGGHRFFTRIPEIEQLWREMLGADLLRVPRQSRIYYRRRFFQYPLELWDTLRNLGPAEGLRILASYLWVRLRPRRDEDSFETWIINRFGARLYETFFRSYTTKVWGLPGQAIQADWAAQRIRNLSLTVAVSDALFGNNRARSLVREFYYPRLGPGMMWQRFQEAVERGGGQVCRQAEVVRLRLKGCRVVSVVARRDGQFDDMPIQHLISSMPLPELIFRLDPLPPEPVLRAAKALRYRSFILVGLIVDQAELFPDNWLYVHEPQVRVGRIQNFKNWSAAMVPDPATTSLGLEYFCTEGDDLWSMSDATLFKQTVDELAALQLAAGRGVLDGVVFRQPKAYPLYDRDYRQAVALIRDFVATLENLQTIGRNGMHRYNNLDHSMLAGLLAARNLLGEAHDLWSLDDEGAYLEER